MTSWGLNLSDNILYTTSELLRFVKTQKMFVARSDAIALAAKANKSTKDTKWEYWSPYFLDYLRAIPGRDVLPLKYIVRANELSYPTMQAVIASVLTTRRIGSISANHLEPKAVTTASNECDTKDDTCCLGNNFVILKSTRRTADVYTCNK